MANLVGTLSQAQIIRDQLLNRQAGKWLLSQNNPNEFDYYMVALELLNSDLSTSKYFIFPVNPNNIEYSDTTLTKITKTAGGISVLKNSQFNVKNITLSGNFGKNFKVLIGDNDYGDLVSYFKEQEGSSLKKVKSTLDNFSSSIKTGYGCTKVLEDLLDTSTKRDLYGGNYYLVLYNLAFNQKFFVEIDTKSFSQSLESNMIWNYNLQFKAIGNVSDFSRKDTNIKSNEKLIVDGVIQQNANTVYSKVSNLLNKLI